MVKGQRVLAGNNLTAAASWTQARIYTLTALRRTGTTSNAALADNWQRDILPPPLSIQGTTHVTLTVCCRGKNFQGMFELVSPEKCTVTGAAPSTGFVSFQLSR